MFQMIVVQKYMYLKKDKNNIHKITSDVSLNIHFDVLLILVTCLTNFTAKYVVPISHYNSR